MYGIGKHLSDIQNRQITITSRPEEAGFLVKRVEVMQACALDVTSHAFTTSAYPGS